jgi:hypothetical protein
MAKDILKFFCQNTTLHGFKYMAQKSRKTEKYDSKRFSMCWIARNNPQNFNSSAFSNIQKFQKPSYSQFIRRFFWISSLIISFILTGQLTYKFLKNSNKNPIVIYVEEKHVNVADLFFPSVTFCPGLILATNHGKVLDYDEIVDDLKQRKLSLDNLTEHE